MMLLQSWFFPHAQNPHVAVLAGWVFIMTVFTYFFIPETKGLLIEDVHEVFATHW